MWPALLGGIGVFLLGMGLLTDGLKLWAGDGLRKFLQRFAGNRVTACATGVVATAFIQSSSATSLITIGLVGAGLVALPNAIAILIGANVGTTATAYLVAFVGLKVSVAAYALPLIGIGALVRLFVHGRWGAVASAVTGFGLLFLGIDLMRGAVSDVAGALDLSSWAGSGPFAAFVLVGVGVVMTVLVQSSSAAMATTLATLDAGAITLQQAAFLAIGQNIGTTVTALVGAVGGSAPARRTAFAHVVFNLGTAAPALLLVTPMLAVSTMVGGEAIVALALFHTSYNVLGLVIFLPLVGLLALRLERWVPDARNPLAEGLDRSALQTPGGVDAAVDAAVLRVADEVVHLVRSRLGSVGRPRDWTRRVGRTREALVRIRDFLEDARQAGQVGPRIAAHVRALDHLHHILLDIDDEVHLAREDVQKGLAPYLAAFRAALDGRHSAESDALFAKLVGRRKSLRRQILKRVEEDSSFGPEAAREQLEALHWMARVAWHLRRVCA